MSRTCSAREWWRPALLRFFKMQIMTVDDGFSDGRVIVCAVLFPVLLLPIRALHGVREALYVS